MRLPSALNALTAGKTAESCARRALAVPSDADSGNSTRAAARSGLAQLPAYFVEEHLARGELVSVLYEQRDRSRFLWLLYPNRAGLAPEGRAMSEHVERAFQKRQRWG